ncbi:MAG: excalibur calcium-binding domain-containing protein [Cyanobacteria bacterium J06554_1]
MAVPGSKSLLSNSSTPPYPDEEKNFTVVTIGEDPHRLDGDKDGIACEARR